MSIVPTARRFAIATGAALALIAELTGCQPTNLYVGSNTIVGLNGAMNADQTAGHLIVGYDRRFAAIVPKSAPVLKDDGSIDQSNLNAHEAMGVLSCSELKVQGIFVTGFTEYLATGDAAREFAKQVADPSAASNNQATTADMTKFFSCAIPHAPKQ
ncbi:MAG TPA: hypothetical protein VFE34_18740 [Dongiaceae bacterium]|jgi:hypothetical protein|nr:hypothetical protein [Dongiaceae bacterium]